MSLSIFCLIVCILIIFFLLFKLYRKNIALKYIIKELNKKTSGTNNIITTPTNDKKINNLANELNKSLKKLREMELQYKNGNKLLQESITNISHDLRTPLAGIKGYIDLLKKEKDENKIKKYINIIDIKTNELTNLTEQLFFYSKSLDLKDALTFEEIWLNNFLEEIILSYYDLFKNKNIIPKINICKKKNYKVIDKVILNRILDNIISNALKYANNNINISLLENGNIIISNKTKMIDAVSVKKIFDRYFTVENASKSSGVGLSIAKQLVSLIDGNIKATYKNGNLIIEIAI